MLEKNNILIELENHLSFLKSKTHSFYLQEINEAEDLLMQNIFHLTIRLLNFSIALNKSVLEMFRSENIFPSVFLIRSQYEVCGVLVNIHDKLDRYYKKELDLNSLNDLIERYSIGSNVVKFEGQDLPNRVQILKGIDRVDAWYKKMSGEGECVFRDRYEYFSEYCHPNLPSLSIITSLKNGKVSTKSNSDIFIEYFPEFSNGMRIPNIVFSHFYEEVLRMLSFK